MRGHWELLCLCALQEANFRKDQQRLCLRTLACLLINKLIN